MAVCGCEGAVSQVRDSLFILLAATLVLAQGLPGQTLTPQTMDWRRVGNANVDLGLAGLASGPVDRVWYTADGASLLIRTAAGKTYETSDFEKWMPVEAQPPARKTDPMPALPERGAYARKATGQTPRAYSLGQFVYRSDNGGGNWENLNAVRVASGVASILGDGLRDLAVSPTNEDDIAVAGASGVFRSLDGGKSWVGLNQDLPNLPVLRLRGIPVNDRGVLLELADSSVVEWQPGERIAWRSANAAEAATDLRLRQALSLQLGTRVTAVKISGDFVYLGLSDGRVGVSSNRGVAWQYFAPSDAGAVTAFWADADDPRVALASLEASRGGTAPRVLRTIDGGNIWDDLTADLPLANVNSVTGDRSSGAIYLATDRGVFFTKGDLGSLAPATPWTMLAGLPQAPAMDVRLDDGANRLWVALEGFGVYSALAPHRIGDPRVISAADFVARAAAPGALVSVAGANVAAASMSTSQGANLAAPVLASSGLESQLQVPFEARGDSMALTLRNSEGNQVVARLPLGSAAPAIFVSRDGSPMLLDSDTGVMLDAMHAAHSGSRIQILATGMGRVTPDWPTGAAAPLENPPKVAAKVQAYLDRSPVEVTRAVLAPGYVGFYLIEIEIPKIVNYGPAELYVEEEGQASNRVRVYVEP
jgi:uncharacterized protein (TIGR03437 family)